MGCGKDIGKEQNFKKVISEFEDEQNKLRIENEFHKNKIH